MTSTVLAVSAAYVVMAVLLLSMGLTSRFAWWVKAVAIVIASDFSSRCSSPARVCWAGQVRGSFRRNFNCCGRGWSSPTA